MIRNGGHSAAACCCMHSRRGPSAAWSLRRAFRSRRLPEEPRASPGSRRPLAGWSRPRKKLPSCPLGSSPLMQLKKKCMTRDQRQSLRNYSRFEINLPVNQLINQCWTLIPDFNHHSIKCTWWFGTNSVFRAGVVGKLALNRVFVPNHHGHPVHYVSYLLPLQRLLRQSRCQTLRPRRTPPRRRPRRGCLRGRRRGRLPPQTPRRPVAAGTSGDALQETSWHL